jgi:peptide chain release factor 1
MTDVNHTLLLKLRELREQHSEIDRQLSLPEIASDHKKIATLSIKRKALDDVVQQLNVLEAAEAELAEYAAIISQGEDAELVALAKEETPILRQQCADLLEHLKSTLVNADDRSVGSLILEVRAGVGGDEAGLWARNILEMYERFATIKRWKFDVLDLGDGDQGGIKHAIVNVSGDGVFAELGFEGGTHQVKRVPATEAQGRMHTSTATVAVLPEPEEVEVDLDPSDVKESITTAQGPGGQNVNKVATAVHLIHEPTGIEVRMQETKSQAQNRDKAWKLLRARLYDKQRAELDAARAAERNSMIGTGSRAEKIRTYRYKDNQVVDHRINESFNLGMIMQGELQALIDSLVREETARRLSSL